MAMLLHMVISKINKGLVMLKKKKKKNEANLLIAPIYTLHIYV